MRDNVVCFEYSKCKDTTLSRIICNKSRIVWIGFRITYKKAHKRDANYVLILDTIGIRKKLLFLFWDFASSFIIYSVDRRLAYYLNYNSFWRSIVNM